MGQHVVREPTFSIRLREGRNGVAGDGHQVEITFGRRMPQGTDGLPIGPTVGPQIFVVIDPMQVGFGYAVGPSTFTENVTWRTNHLIIALRPLSL